MTVRLGPGVTFVQIGICGSGAAVGPEVLRRHGPQGEENPRRTLEARPPVGSAQRSEKALGALTLLPPLGEGSVVQVLRRLICSPQPREEMPMTRNGRVVFSPMEEVVFGRPAAQAVAEQAERLGATRVLLMVSGTLARETDEVARIRAALGNRVAAKYRMPAHTPRHAVVERPAWRARRTPT